jgi:hypothetical protein
MGDPREHSARAAGTQAKPGTRGPPRDLDTTYTLDVAFNENGDRNDWRDMRTQEELERWDAAPRGPYDAVVLATSSSGELPARSPVPAPASAVPSQRRTPLKSLDAGLLKVRVWRIGYVNGAPASTQLTIAWFGVKQLSLFAESCAGGD